MKIPTNIDKRFGPRSKGELKRRVVALDRKVLQFLEQKPICLDCKEALNHFSYTMLCSICRAKRDYRKFVGRNPLYKAQWWQKNKVRQTIRYRKYYLGHKDEINFRRRFKRREKRRNYEDSLRFKLERLERDVRAKGLISQAPTI